MVTKVCAGSQMSVSVLSCRRLNFSLDYLDISPIT